MSESLQKSPEQTTDCPHNSTRDGPQIPRVYGSGGTTICMLCGAWRPSWNPGVGWRAADTLTERMRANDER